MKVHIYAVEAKFTREADLADAAVQLVLDCNGSQQKTSLSTDHQWHHQFDALDMDPKSKLRLSVHNNMMLVGKRHLSVESIYKHNDWSENRFTRQLQFDCGTVSLEFLIEWPTDWSAADRQGWAIDHAELAMRKIKELDCNKVFARDLVSMIGFDFILILDDSGSMAETTEHGTRWSELRSNVELLVDLCGSLDRDGIDLIFLNRRGQKKVKTLAEVQHLFRKQPSGGTDLATAVRKALKRKGDAAPMLIILATDGVPNDLRDFECALAERPSDVYVSMLACSNNADDVDYLNRLDETLPRVDVLDDYYSEKKQVEEAQGGSVNYSRGDHCARMLLGPVFPQYDKLDEQRLPGWT